MKGWRYARDWLLSGRSEGNGYDLESWKVKAERGEPILDMVFCEEGRIDGVGYDGADEEGIVRTDARKKGRAICWLEAYGS